MSDEGIVKRHELIWPRWKKMTLGGNPGEATSMAKIYVDSFRRFVMGYADAAFLHSIPLINYKDWTAVIIFYQEDDLRSHPIDLELLVSHFSKKDLERITEIYWPAATFETWGTLVTPWLCPEPRCSGGNFLPSDPEKMVAPCLECRGLGLVPDLSEIPD